MPASFPPVLPESAHPAKTGPHGTGPGRIRKRRDFLAAGKSGRRQIMPSVIVLAARSRSANKKNGEKNGEAIRAGFTASRRTGNAVVRNRARRRLKELARRHLPRLGAPGHDYVFIARKDTASCPAPRLAGQFAAALRKLAKN